MQGSQVGAAEWQNLIKVLSSHSEAHWSKFSLILLALAARRGKLRPSSAFAGLAPAQSAKNGLAAPALHFLKKLKIAHCSTH